MVSASDSLPAAPDRLLPLRGLALAALLHAAVVLLALATSWRVVEEPPVFEVMLALPAPAAPQQPALPQPAEPVQPVRPPEPAAAPVPAPAPSAARESATALPPPDAVQTEAAPPRPTTKPAPPARPAEPLPAPADTAPAAALLPPAEPAPLPAAPLAAPAVAPPALPAVPPLQAYALLLRDLLAVHREYPHAARQRRQEGVVSIALTIDRAGQLAAVRLYEASTFPLLDEAALAMARRAAPFPPPPLEPHQRQAVFVVPVGFALQE